MNHKNRNIGASAPELKQEHAPKALRLTSRVRGRMSLIALIMMTQLQVGAQTSTTRPKGILTMPPSPSIGTSGTAPSVTSVTPINGGGSPRTFTAVYTDPAGSANLSNLYLLFNSSLNDSGGCWIIYVVGTNEMWLMNETGTGTSGGPIVAGRGGSAWNSLCTIRDAGRPTAAGNTLTLQVNVEFTANFTGTKNVYGLAAGLNGKISGYQLMGTWTPNATDNGIQYHKGPIMTGTTKMYYIWYGNWAGNSAMSLLPALATGLGGSQYFNINTTYYNGTGTHVSNAVQYGGSTSVMYPYGKSLTEDSVKQIVADAINSRALPMDANGVYFVLGSSDVAETGPLVGTFCKDHCGWHFYAPINGTTVKYAFVGNGEICGCRPLIQGSSTPNNNAGADGMANVIAHELSEAVTDPELSAWWEDRRGYENADKCAWTFGTTSALSNGAKYNVTLGGLKFLLQQNWVNASGGYCALQF